MIDINLIDESLSANYQCYNQIIFESGFYDFIDNTIVMIRKFISELKARAKKFIADIRALIRRISLPMKLNKMKKDLLNHKDNGLSTVEMIDYKRISEYYDRMAKELANDLKKPLMETSYKNKEKFQNDIDMISNKLDLFNKNMKLLLERKIEIPIDKAIDIVNSELKGETLVYRTFIKTLDQFDKRVADLEKIKRNANIVSDQYLKKNHLNIIQRQIHRIGQTLSTWMSKIVRTIVFFFA